jgi:caspase-like apoptosis-related cysteine protease
MEFSDGEREYTETIIDMFSNVKCNVLVHKPKVFLFPFCRGKYSDKFTNVYIPIVETDGKMMNLQYTVPTVSDILICYGTVPNYMTHRDIEFGSWYVREFCKVFATSAYDCHIEELLKLVGSNTLSYKEPQGRTQVTSTETRGFNKLLFLNPKIHD